LTPFEEYKQLCVDLAELEWIGEDSSKEANAIRDEMDAPWHKLVREEQNLFNHCNFSPDWQLPVWKAKSDLNPLNVGNTIIGKTLTEVNELFFKTPYSIRISNNSDKTMVSLDYDEYRFNVQTWGQYITAIKYVG